MATIINNRATVNYRYGANTGATVSNTTDVSVNNALEIQKTSLSQTYRNGQEITYIISLQNESSGNITITVSDDLGTYTFNCDDYTPLTFTGTARLFINGIYHSALNPTEDDHELIFSNIVIPANGNALILYSARINQFADCSEASEITNTATAFICCDCPCAQSVSDSNTISAESFAEIRLIKSGCPNTVVCGEELSYLIDIYNYGNLPATDVILTDTFTPPLSDITVSADGIIIPESDYSYINGTLTIPNQSGETELTVPAATFTHNPVTGIVEVTPGRLQIVIKGTI